MPYIPINLCLSAVRPVVAGPSIENGVEVSITQHSDPTQLLFQPDPVSTADETPVAPIAPNTPSPSIQHDQNASLTNATATTTPVTPRRDLTWFSQFATGLSGTSATCSSHTLGRSCPLSSLSANLHSAAPTSSTPPLPASLANTPPNPPIAPIIHTSATHPFHSNESGRYISCLYIRVTIH